MGVHPANLTHHFKLLEKSGLIALVEKRDTGKNLEKFYRARAYHFTVQPSEQLTNRQVLALSVLRDSLCAAIQTLQHSAEERAVLGVLKTVPLSPEDVEKFGQKLLALTEEFAGHAVENGSVYSLNVSLYPTEAGPMPAREILLHAEK